MDKVLNLVRNFIAAHNLLNKRSKVIVGLSGGPDSVCLMHILHCLGYEILAIHCNFHLRGEESDRDERFVKALCQSMNVECLCTEFNTTQWAREKGMSIEMAARELRYGFFRSVKKERNCQSIAVGHHKDDNTETMLLNMVRGTGIQGLCAMPPRNNDVVRPLLCLSREDIRKYIERHQLSFVTDHTNLEDDYSRNKIRLDVMPLLCSINPAASANICDTIENLNEVRKVYRDSMEKAIRYCVETTQRGDTYINIRKLKEQPSPTSVLHEVLNPHGFSRANVLDVERCINIDEGTSATGKMFISSTTGDRVLIDRGSIIVESRTADERCARDVPKLVIEEVDVANCTIVKDAKLAFIDADKVRHELTLRTPKEGDTFAPFGMNGRRKLLSDFLTNLKLNRFEKEQQLLLCDGDEIVWVAERRSSELYRVTSATKRVLVVSINWQ